MVGTGTHALVHTRDHRQEGVLGGLGQWLGLLFGFVVLDFPDAFSLARDGWVSRFMRCSLSVYRGLVLAELVFETKSVASCAGSIVKQE